LILEALAEKKHPACESEQEANGSGVESEE
jgi:hypothetical protein